MRRFLCLLLIICLMPAAAVCAQLQDGIYQDVGAGYTSDVIVEATVRGGKLTALSAARRDGEENEYHLLMVSDLLPRIIEAGGIDGVDATSGATGSSESVFEAMRGILIQAQSGVKEQPEGAQADRKPQPTIDPAGARLTMGLGGATNFRVGPGKDEQGNQVYSFNVAMAAVAFDKDGRIVQARVDVYEVATPNYDGASMPVFTGWPMDGSGEEAATNELAAWRTKRERGDEYNMNERADWYEQMDFYEGWMAGKTVGELREWFDRSTTSAGRPIKADTTDENDRAKYDALSGEERQELADVVSGATMSLSDAHGLLLEAVEKAYENRVAVE